MEMTVETDKQIVEHNIEQNEWAYHVVAPWMIVDVHEQRQQQ